MRKKVFRKRAAAFTIAAAMVLSVVNVPAIGSWQMPMATVQAAETSVLYEKSDSQSVEIDFSSFETEDWTDKGKVTSTYDNAVGGVEIPENILLTADVTVDADTYATLTEGSYFKIVSVLKLGEEWTWTQCADKDIAYISSDSFTEEDSDYKATISVPFNDLTLSQLMEIDFVMVGAGVKGTVAFSNVKIEEVVVMEKTTIYQSEEEKTATADFSELEELDWSEEGSVTFTYDGAVSDVTVTEDFEVTADIEIDAEAFATLAEGKYFLVQSVVKLGDNWTWTDSQDIKTLNADSFEEEDGNYKTAITISHTGVTVDALKAVLFKIVGVGFKGDIKFSNVVISGLAPEEVPELEPKEPTVIADFEEGQGDWEPEKGYSYHAGKPDSEGEEYTTIEWDEELKALKVSLDYSADSANSWSEAKVKLNDEKGFDVSAYNVISYDVISSEALDGKMQTKVYAASDNGKEIINTFTDLESEEYESGLRKVTVSIKFSPNANPINNLTIGFIGVKTDFVGDVWLDNVTLSQFNASEDYVEITEDIKEAAQASLENMATEVKLVDSGATNETKVLAAYLAALQSNDQVLFGHQNSTFKSVRYNGEKSDILDITGSEAGLFGIDTLALAGCETAQTTRQKALDASVEASMKAYNGGSIITLSCHMPNFTNEKIKKIDDPDNPNYPYDFTKCDFMESKDMTPCADYILDGGEYNPQFNAYLDIIADYALKLQEKGIPVLFRPFHENSGNWFWWGTSTSVESYQAMWRYMVDYLEAKGVHNFLYVYSPNGPFSDTDTYLERYPGDAYVDVIAFDYYDDYADVETYTGDAFFDALGETCAVVAKIAKDKGKIPAIAETGIRITGAGKDSLMVSGNPTKDKDWYNNVIEKAVENDIPYFLLWANFDSENFFVPYKYNDKLGQEMINDFIKAYNNPNSIFGNGTNFYTKGDMGKADAAVSKAEDVELEGYSEDVGGYMISPKNYAVIKEPYDMQASVKNADKVEFQVKASDAANAIIVEGVKAADGNIYTGTLSAEVLAEIGPASTGSVIVVAYDAEGNSVIIGSAKYINFNKDADVLPQNVIDNFEFYYGSDGLLQSKWGDDNSAAGCSSTMTLDSENKVEGEYSGAFEYTLTYKGSEVWTGGLGRVFDADKTDFTAYNAISMWVKPDGNGQKMVIQLNDSYEAYLSDFVKGTKAQYVTIPFTSFIKKGGTEAIDSANIYSFRLWCNSIPENYPGVKAENGNYTVSGIINFDDIKAVKISDEDLDKADDNGLIITDAALKDLSGESGDDKKEDDKKEDDKKEDDKKEDDKQPVDPQPGTQEPGTTDPGIQTPQPAAKDAVIADEASGAEFTVTVSDAVNGEVSYNKPTNAKATKVTIPDTITKDGITYKVTSIAKNAFKGNKKLKTVKIGNNIKTIGANAFSGCTNLKTVTIGSNVTEIGAKAFYKCTKLTKITIPAQVNKIGKQSFANCKKLKKITIKTTKLTNKNVGAKAFKGIYSKATIKVPKAKLKAYQTLLKKKGVGSKAKIKK